MSDVCACDIHLLFCWKYIYFFRLLVFLFVSHSVRRCYVDSILFIDIMEIQMCLCVYTKCIFAMSNKPHKIVWTANRVYEVIFFLLLIVFFYSPALCRTTVRLFYISPTSTLYLVTALQIYGFVSFMPTESSNWHHGNRWPYAKKLNSIRYCQCELVCVHIVHNYRRRSWTFLTNLPKTVINGRAFVDDDWNEIKNKIN